MRAKFEEFARTFEEIGVKSISQNAHMHTWRKPVDPDHLVAIIRSFLSFINEGNSLELPMKIVERLNWLTDQAKACRLIITNIEQDEIDAILTIFINFVAGLYWCDYGLYSCDLR